MAIKPILFNTEMVRAILEGRKTQTRRFPFPAGDLKEFCSADYPDGWWYKGRVFRSFYEFIHYPQSPRCKYRIDDILWVRETWSTTDKCGLFPPWPSNGTHYMYKGDSPEHELAKEARWFPSIHMPKEAARIFLRVLNVRIERLQDITDEGAQREGVRSPYPHLENGAIQEFIPLWDSTLKKTDLPIAGWGANPWVWVIEFERCEKPEGWC